VEEPAGVLSRNPIVTVTNLWDGVMHGIAGILDHRDRVEVCSLEFSLDSRHTATSFKKKVDRWWMKMPGATGAAMPRKIKKADEAEHLELKQRALNDQLRQQAALRLWEETRKQLRMAYDSLCTDLSNPGRLQWDDKSSNEVSIRTANGKSTVHLRFDHRTLELRMDLQVYEPQVADQQGTVLWAGQGLPVYPHEVARKVMDYLVDSISNR
jgi:hypothetical protein